MHDHRPVPSLESMDDSYADSGHFWLQEEVIGRVLRFQLTDAGMLRFGSSQAVFDPADIPPHYRPAVASIRSSLDRDRLRDGVADVEAYTFVGVVPLGDGIEYDWDSIPPFLGHDIWDGTAERFATDDVVERVFEGIGLATVPTVRKEVPATHLGLANMSFPAARWAEKPVPGLVVRKKNGPIAKVTNPEWEPAEPAAVIEGEASLESFLEEQLTETRLEQLAAPEGGTLADKPGDELGRAVAGELARREFGTVGRQVQRHPERFDRAVSSRIRTLRRAQFE